MDALVRFTQSPRRVTAAGPAGPLDTVEFVNFRSLQLTLTLLGFEGASDPVLQIGMETGMRFDRGYTSLGRFLPLVASGQTCCQHFDGVMRFVRWNVIEFTGASAAVFMLEGQARP